MTVSYRSTGYNMLDQDVLFRYDMICIAAITINLTFCMHAVIQ